MKTNLYVDLGIFAAFLVVFEPALTGVTIHEWFSLAFAAAIVVHLLLHWNWIVSVTVKFFRKLWHTSRLNYVLNVLLLAAFVAIMLSGIMISRSVAPVLGLQLGEAREWRFIHSSAANFSLLLLGLHVALHWKWIVSALKRYVFSFFRRPAARPALQAAPVPVRTDERH